MRIAGLCSQAVSAYSLRANSCHSLADLPEPSRDVSVVRFLVGGFLSAVGVVLSSNAVDLARGSQVDRGLRAQLRRLEKQPSRLHQELRERAVIGPQPARDAARMK